MQIKPLISQVKLAEHFKQQTWRGWLPFFCRPLLGTKCITADILSLTLTKNTSDSCQTHLSVPDSSLPSCIPRYRMSAVLPDPHWADAEHWLPDGFCGPVTTSPHCGPHKAFGRRLTDTLTAYSLWADMSSSKQNSPSFALAFRYNKMAFGKLLLYSADKCHYLKYPKG